MKLKEAFKKAVTKQRNFVKCLYNGDTFRVVKVINLI